MNRLTENKIILVVRKTRLDELLVRFNTLDQARFYIEHLDMDFSDYLREDTNYKKSVTTASNIISRLGRLQILAREYITNYVFGAEDIVVAIGQDGLVANTLKYLERQPIIGVNPDPDRWEGVLLPFTVDDLSRVVTDFFAGKMKIREVSMAKAALNSGEVLYGVNDIFIGPRSHTSAKYRIEIEGKEEIQSSSGIIVSTGLGSTGWFRSIVTGARGISANLALKNADASTETAFAWESDFLYYSVREPWPSKTTSASITFGRIIPGKPLQLESLMAENGVIFSDGIESDFLRFDAGRSVEVSVAEKKGHLVV